MKSHQVLAMWALGTVVGKGVRFYAAFFLAIAGFVLSFAWTIGPQQVLDARYYDRLTARADARIVDRWLAVEWKSRWADRAPDWRNAATASACAVLEYDGDWGSTRRAFCGTRIPFYSHYDVHGLDELAPGVPFEWARDGSGLSVPEIRVAPYTLRYLEKKPAVVNAFPHIEHAKNALEALQFELVAPTDSAIRGWSAVPAKITLAVDPADPEASVPAGFIEKRERREPVWVAALIAGAIGLAFWWAGMMTLLAHVPILARAILTVIPLAALPWWGDELPKYLARVSEDMAEVVEDMLGSVNRLGRLKASAPEDALLAGGERLSWKPGGPPYAETFGRLKLTAPPRPFASPDAALAALTEVAAAQVRALPPEERAALFGKLQAEKKLSLYGAGLTFVPAAREALVDGRNDPALRRAAYTYLSEWLTQPVLEPHLRQIAFKQRVEIFRSLMEGPEPVVRNISGWIVERADKAAAEAAAKKP